VDCCVVREAEAFALGLDSDGHFVQAGRRREDPSGEFEDASTGEQLLIEVHGGTPRVGYRPRGAAGWKRLVLSKTGRGGEEMTVKFPKGPATYGLTVDLAGGAVTVTSKAPDGTKRQVFTLVPTGKRRI